jgi:hypothetical protein
MSDAGTAPQLIASVRWTRGGEGERTDSVNGTESGARLRRDLNFSSVAGGPVQRPYLKTNGETQMMQGTADPHDGQSVDRTSEPNNVPDQSAGFIGILRAQYGWRSGNRQWEERERLSQRLRRRAGPIGMVVCCETPSTLERAVPPNNAMKLTELSAAPLRGRSAASCPRRPMSDAGTAPQLIASVRWTRGGESERTDSVNGEWRAPFGAI